MSKTSLLKFGGVNMPTPQEVSFTNNKIWSQNTGRTASCKMVGDIIGIKKSIHIEWLNLKADEIKLINGYISSAANSFFTVTILNEEFEQKSYKVYASDPSYEVWGWDEKRRLVKGLAVDLIEQ